MTQNPKPVTLLTAQRTFVDPSMVWLDTNNWLRLKDSQSDNEINFNLEAYGFTVLVWERPDDEDRS